MKIGRPVSAAISTHEAKTTAIHGVGTSYLPKTSQSDQSLSDNELVNAVLQSLLDTRGDMLYRAVSVAAKLAKGTSGQYLKIGQYIPAWAPAPCEAALTTRGDLLYESAAGLARLAKGTEGYILTQGTNDPTWAALDVGEGHILLLPPNYDSIGQGTWVLDAHAQYYFYWVFYNSTGADGDNLSWKIYLQAGTYTLRMLYGKGTANGIIDIDINATEVTSVDTYAGSGSNNNVHTEANISIATSGLYTIKLRIHGKNESSSDYYSKFNYIALWRTA